MNILFLIGLAVFFGAYSGNIFRKVKVPQVVGYIVIGLILGGSISGLISKSDIESITPLINFIIGIIGFLIGAELKSEVFKKYGRSIYTILISEGLFAFAAVTAAVTIITGKLYLGLLLGAIASATDPASTVNVLWEYKAKGPLTTTLTSIVALDDGLALILYGLVSVFSKAMITREVFSFWHSIVSPLFEIFQCALLGVAGGLLLIKALSYIKEQGLALSFAFGGVAAVVGLSMHLKLDLILSSMILGATVSNIIPDISQKLFRTLKEITMPLYILFFIIVGASLDIHIFLKFSIVVVILGYLFARSIGKIAGATLGGIISRGRKTVIKYTGICLFTQGGVALGLALSISHNLSYLGEQGRLAGSVVISVVAATTFVVQIFGPFLVKFGVAKANEGWRNVTEDDIIESSKVEDFMSKDFSPISEDATLDKVIETIKERESYNFPVVDKEGGLVGLISLGSLRNVFREAELDKVILASDLAVPAGTVLHKGQPLKEAFEIFDKREIDYLPVVKDEMSKQVVGILEYRLLVESINRKLLERQRGLEDGTGKELGEER